MTERLTWLKHRKQGLQRRSTMVLNNSHGFLCGRKCECFFHVKRFSFEIAMLSQKAMSLSFSSLFSFFHNLFSIIVHGNKWTLPTQSEGFLFSCNLKVLYVNSKPAVLSKESTRKGQYVRCINRYTRVVKRQRSLIN